MLGFSTPCSSSSSISVAHNWVSLHITRKITFVRPKVLSSLAGFPLVQEKNLRILKESNFLVGFLVQVGFHYLEPFGIRTKEYILDEANEVKDEQHVFQHCR